MKIGDNSTTINSASLLELETTNKGLVFPRVSLTDVASSSPLPSGLLTGTVVYNTNPSVTNGNGTGLYIWGGSVWTWITTNVTSSSAWSITGNSGLNASTNFIGTADAIDFIARTNNLERMRILGAASLTGKPGWIGMGITTPRSSLDVTGDYTNKNVITVQNTSSTGFSSVDMLDNTGALKGTFGYANSGTGGLFASKNYFNIYGNDFVFTTNSGSYNFFIKGSTGFIGLNTNTPSERLHLVGNFYLNGAFMPGGNAGTSGYVLTSAGAGVSPTWTNPANFAWSLTGNTGTSYATNFLGTGDNVSMRFRTNNVQRMIIDSLGRVGVGLNNPSYALSVLSATNPLYLSGVQPTAAFSTDSLLTIYNGVVKKAPSSSLNNISWSLTGNSGTNYATNFLGTTDNTSLRFRTNNTEQMVIDSLGRVGIGSSSFNTLHPAKFLVDYGNTTSNTIVNLRGSVDDYFQINLQNKSNGIYSSSDYVATSDDGTDSTYYIDMGINGSNYAPSVENWGGPHDAYLYASSRNLVIGTQSGGSDVIFLVGGGKVKPNAIMRLNSSDGHVIIGKGEQTTSPGGTTLRGPNAQTGSINIAGGSFTVSGGSSTGTATGGTLNITGGAATSSGIGGTLNLNGGTSSSGTGGIVVVNTSSTERMRIDALGNVGIANTTPSEKLDVTGNVRFSGALLPNNLAGTSGYLLSSSGAGVAPVWIDPAAISSTYGWVLGGNTLLSQKNFGTLNNYPIPFYTNGAERMRITNTGLIGIGTTTPASDLTIFQSSGSGSSKGFTFTGNSISGTSSGTGFLMSLGYNTTGNKQLWLGDGDYAGNAAGSFARFVVTGTSFPVFDAVSGNGLLRRYLAFGVAGDANSGVIFGGDNTSVNPGSQVWDNGNMTIGAGYKSYAAPSNGLLVQGNVGIGTAAPTSALSVLAATNPLYLSGVQATVTFSTDSILTILNGIVKKTPYSSLPGGNSWAITGNSGTSASTNFIGTADGNDFVTKTNNVERMRLTTGGSLGIGVTIPQQLLSVGNGMTVDQNDGNTGTTANTLIFGSNSGEAVGSKRNAGGNQWGLDFYTNFTNRMVITNAGLVGIGTTNPGYKLSVLASSNPLYLSGVQATGSVSTDSVLTILNGVVKKAPYSSFSSGGSGWGLTGNSGTSTGTNFLGTTDGNGLVFKVNNTQAGYLGLSGSSYATSFGVGSSGTTTAFQATAIGAGAQATANDALALGYNSTASIQDAIAIGNSAQAKTNNEAIAIGHNSTATSYQGISLGVSSSSSNNQTIAIGVSSNASGYQGIAIGNSSSATTNNNALAVGVSASASGFQSAAIGNSASATASNSTAIGNGATTSQTNALVLGNSSANVGIGTSTPNTNTKLDVSGFYKLGSNGTVTKNSISFSSTVSSTTINTQYTTVTVFLTPNVVTLNGNTNYVDVTFTLPNAATNTQATVIVSPGFDLPDDIVIAFARLTSTTQGKVRFMNLGAAARTFSGTIYVTVTDF
ncbi:MAG: hypothetical protein ABI405_01075 [Parafilimonas sp.]